MSNVNAFAVSADDGALKRLKIRMGLNKTPTSPVLSSDLANIRTALGIATGQQPYGAAPAYTSDFSAGADSFANNAGTTVAGNIDAITDGTTSKDDCLRITSDGTNGNHIAARPTGFVIGKKYRIEGSVYIPAGNVTAQKLRIGAGVVTAPPGATIDVSPTLGTWTAFSGEFTATATSTQIWLALMTGASATSFVGTNGELVYVKDLKVFECGLRQFYSIAVAIDFPSIAAAASNDQTVTLTGVAVGDAVYLGLPAAPQAGLIFQGFVSAANTVTIRAMNITASAVDAASATYRVTVAQF